MGDRELTNEEIQAECQAIINKFARENVDISQIFQGREFTIACQANSLSKLLIEKGIITQEEHDTAYHTLVLERLREFQENMLGEIRGARMRQEAKQKMSEIYVPGK